MKNQYAFWQRKSNDNLRSILESEKREKAKREHEQLAFFDEHAIMSYSEVVLRIDALNEKAAVLEDIYSSAFYIAKIQNSVLNDIQLCSSFSEAVEQFFIISHQKTPAEEWAGYLSM